MKIAISGKMRVGKDEVAKLLIARLPHLRRIALADEIKSEYSRATGIPIKIIEQYKTVPLIRKQLIFIGQYRKLSDLNYWVHIVTNLENVVIPDVRFTCELDELRNKNTKFIRVEASREVREARGRLSNETDSSETELDNYTGWDYIIMNNGNLEDLSNQVDKAIQVLGLDKPTDEPYKQLPVVGVDVGRGEDHSVYVIRQGSAVLATGKFN